MLSETNFRQISSRLRCFLYAILDGYQRVCKESSSYLPVAALVDWHLRHLKAYLGIFNLPRVIAKSTEDRWPPTSTKTVEFPSNCTEHSSVTVTQSRDDIYLPLSTIIEVAHGTFNDFRVTPFRTLEVI
jgi:hypothetical protein